MHYIDSRKLDYEEREAKLPHWAQEKIAAGRKMRDNERFWRERLTERDDEITELRRQLAEGVTRPDSDTWIMPDGAEVDEQAIGLGTGPLVAFGPSFDDSLFTVRLNGEGLDISGCSSGLVVRTASNRIDGELRIELA